MLNRLFALISTDVSIQALEQVVAHAEITREKVEHADHLTEDQHPVAFRFELGKQFVQQDELARIFDQLLEVFVFAYWFRLDTVEEIRVVCGFLALHRNVEQGDVRGATFAERLVVLLRGRKPLCPRLILDGLPW